jgi:uncharacterized protein (DUF2147 family)
MIRSLALALGVLLSLHASQAAPAPIGLWLTQDHDGVIAISPCGDRLCGRLVGVFLDRPDDKTPVDNRGVSQCDLMLITDALQVRPGLWKGHITDPRSGDVWGMELHRDPNGNLALRGFLGIPLLGRTQTWTRYLGTPPADCRIVPPGAATGQRRGLPVMPRKSQ